MNKKLVVIEQGKYVDHELTLSKHAALKEAEIDIIRFNWFTDNDPRATYTPKDINGEKLRWSEGRDFLISKAVDKYDFIMYTDEDTFLRSVNSSSNPWSLLSDFLHEWNPIGVNVHTPNIWCHDPRILSRLEKGETTIVRKHDACNVILRNDICKLMHPLKYAGSDASTHYQQFMCHTLRKAHYLSPPNLIAVNGIEEQHFHTDDRQTAYYDRILKNFASDLKDSESFYPHFTSSRAVTTEGLLGLTPLKNAPHVEEGEYLSYFK